PLAALMGALLMAVRASASISGERERRTWDDALLMPLTTQEVLEAKAGGLLRAAVPYQIAYFVAALPGACLAGAWPAVLVAAVWVTAVWALSWPLLYFAAAVGLECSARSGGSWQA